MTADPLSDVITHLRPRTVFTKGISGAGRWGVRYTAFGHPSFAAVLEGACRLAVEGVAPITLAAGDFVLLPATPAFVMSGFEAVAPKPLKPTLSDAPAEEVRHGKRSGPPDVRLLGGYFIFDSPDAAFLAPLLPQLVHVRSAGRLARLTELVREESRERHAGRDLVLSRLVEVLLIEALRVSAREQAAPGLLRGLSDDRVAHAIRAIHAEPARDWTARDLAHEAALSRSVFFERFTHAIGMTPMDYLLGWRMTLAKALLRQPRIAVDLVAEKVGYASASAFTTAFSKYVGQPPKRYARGFAAHATSTLRD